MSLKPGDDFTIVTMSFDPREGPELSARARDMALARFDEDERDSVKKGWHFLTGDEAAIKAVTDAVGFRYVYDNSTKQYAHASGIFVADAGRHDFALLGRHQLFAARRAIRVVEASNGKVGSVAIR